MENYIAQLFSLAECSAPLRIFLKIVKNSKKNSKNFFQIFLAINIPHPIWGLPAKIWGV
jgi:hypothetical protein